MGSLCMCHLRRGEGEGQDGDVVLLPEVLRGAGDFIGGMGAERAGSIEAEKLALRILGFSHAIGEEGEGVSPAASWSEASRGRLSAVGRGDTLPKLPTRVPLTKTS